jgi:hypothetical protein
MKCVRFFLAWMQLHTPTCWLIWWH